MGSEINGFDNSITESTFSVHYKNLGFGISNESMWFGPGFHSSISMSNNSEGLLHKFIGTLKEKELKILGLALGILFLKTIKALFLITILQFHQH